MSLYKYWKKLFPQQRRVKRNSLKDIKAIQDYLQDLHEEEKYLKKELGKLLELEKEAHVAKSGILHVNLETQGQILDKLLPRYEFFQNDVDISGLRLQSIAVDVIERANKLDMKDFVKLRKKNWKLQW